MGFWGLGHVAVQRRLVLRVESVGRRVLGPGFSCCVRHGDYTFGFDFSCKICDCGYTW